MHAQLVARVDIVYELYSSTSSRVNTTGGRFGFRGPHDSFDAVQRPFQHVLEKEQNRGQSLVLKDASLEDSGPPPEPNAVAAEIAEDLK